jgi:hypothetical protein
LHHGGVAGGADGKAVLAHGVGQPGGVACAAEASTRQQVTDGVGQGTVWCGGDDLVFDELSQTAQDHRSAADLETHAVWVTRRNQSVAFSGVPIGKVMQSTFNDTGPGPDQGWASITNFLFEATSEINTFTNGMLRSVSGSATSMRGDFVCMAGQVSKFRCGTVEQTGMPVNLPFKVGNTTVRRDVTNLTRTTYCSGFGDSGAPVVSEGFAAAGIHVASDSLDGVTGCALFPNGASYYQPVEPILTAYGLELLRPSAPRPTALHITSAECGREATGPGWVCFARWAGGVDPATASWSVYHPRPTPYVITDSSARMTEAHFACFFDEAESDYYTQLTIRDAVGTQVSWSAYVCSW